jgi:hypothetical protein
VTHLRWVPPALPRHCGGRDKYASRLHPSSRMGTRRGALYLDLFEQPGHRRESFRVLPTGRIRSLSSRGVRTLFLQHAAESGGDDLGVPVPQTDGIDDEDTLSGLALAEMDGRLALLESQGERKGR